MLLVLIPKDFTENAQVAHPSAGIYLDNYSTHLDAEASHP